MPKRKKVSWSTSSATVHRDDREITRETAGKPLIFIVPQRFWREHLGSTVSVAYTVERLDDVSQASAVTLVRVEA